MKKSALALAVLAALSLNRSASAQSNVQVYGLIDAGVDQAIDLDVRLGAGGPVQGKRRQDGEREGRLLHKVSGYCHRGSRGALLFA